MGAGKSTIGRHLAKELGKRFVDSDRELEARTGTTIPVIFDIEGEAGFRRREALLVQELTHETGIVLATGGGAVQDPHTRAALKAGGFTIYLCASLADLVVRTRRDHSRPLLNGVDPRGRLEELLVLRDPWYREVADLVVETGRPSVARVVAHILETLKTNPQGRTPWELEETPRGLA